MMTATDLKRASTRELWDRRDALTAAQAAELEQITAELAERWKEMTPQKRMAESTSKDGEEIVVTETSELFPDSY